MLLNRLRALFLRYATHHAARLHGVGLPRHGLRRTGQIERITRDPAGLRIEGWAASPELRFVWPGGALTVRPDQRRGDVPRRVGGADAMGFGVTLPASARPLSVRVVGPSGRVRQLAVAHPAENPSPSARRRMQRAFLRDLLRAAPALARFAVYRTEGHRAAVKAALGLTTAAPLPSIDPRWLRRAGAAPMPDPGRFTIILPVHDAFEVLTECLDRVARYTSGDWRILVVDDASADPRVAPFLAEWVAAQGGRARLISLEENAGFVAAVNHALASARASDGPVILLNSDALVPAGWAPRLLAPLADPSVASATPLSNDAEIFGAPLPCRKVDLGRGMADILDAHAQALAPPSGPLADPPTGVGFCMALSRRWLDQVPRLDPAFGRGYGEEVDWCRRTARLGARHVAVPTLFVEHRGGQSFGATKPARVRAANARIAARYPQFDAAVQAYLAADPLRTPRMALALGVAWQRSRGRLPVYLAHSLGGGADAALSREIAAALDAGRAAAVLRVGGRRRFTVECHLPEGVIAADSDVFADVGALLWTVPRLALVYSCGVGDRDPVQLPSLLLSLRRPEDSLEARLHDYFPLSPSYCLLDADGRFRGAPQPRDADHAHVIHRPDGRAVPLSQWQASWGSLLSSCGRIVTFSRTSEALLLGVYPDLADRVALRPHAPPHLPAPLEPPPGPGAIGVLGNLNRQKGAQVVARLSERLAAARDPRRIVVIGNVDATCAMPSRVAIGGGYAPEDIREIARRHRIGCWIVPAVWPETFSFTTHEALATGLPVLSFAIGGQGEACAAAPNGHAVPFDPETDLAARLFAALPRPWTDMGAMAPAEPLSVAYPGTAT